MKNNHFKIDLNIQITKEIIKFYQVLCNGSYSAEEDIRKSNEPTKILERYYEKGYKRYNYMFNFENKEWFMKKYYVKEMKSMMVKNLIENKWLITGKKKRMPNSVDMFVMENCKDIKIINKIIEDKPIIYAFLENENKTVENTIIMINSYINIKSKTFFWLSILFFIPREIINNYDVMKVLVSMEDKVNVFELMLKPNENGNKFIEEEDLKKFMEEIRKRNDEEMYEKITKFKVFDKYLKEKFFN